MGVTPRRGTLPGGVSGFRSASVSNSLAREPAPTRVKRLLVILWLRLKICFGIGHSVGLGGAMHYRLYVSELQEAYNNRNYEQALSVAKQGASLAEELVTASLPRMGHADTKDRLRALCLDVGKSVSRFRRGGPNYGVEYTDDSKASSFLAAAGGKYRALVDELLGLDASPTDLSFFLTFHAVMWLSVVQGSQRIEPLSDKDWKACVSLAGGLADKSILLCEENWIGWKLRPKLSRYASDRDPSKDGFPQTIGLLFDSVVRVVSYLKTQKGQDRATLDAAVDLGCLLNDVGRALEAWAMRGRYPTPKNSAGVLRPFPDRADGTEGTVADAVGVHYAATHQDQVFALKSLLGVEIKDLTDFERGLVLAYASFGVAIDYMTTFPEPFILERNLRSALLDQTGRAVQLHVAIHNQGRMLEKLAREIRTKDLSPLVSAHLEQAAADCYRHALEYDPDYSAAHENYGLLLLRRKDYERARRHLERLGNIYSGQQNKRQYFLDFRIGQILIQKNQGQRELHKYLQESPTLDRGAGDHVTVLKRWNSYTPSLPSKQRSRGGGYFLNLGGTGVAIDPGFNFLENMKRERFSLADMDHLLISHTHADHVHDLEDLILLRYETRKRLRDISSDVRPPLNIWAHPRVLRQVRKRVESFIYKDILDGIVTWNKLAYWPDSRVVASSREPGHGQSEILVACTPALHADPTGSGRPKACYATGFRIEHVVKGNPPKGRQDRKVVIGLTGDSAWFKGIEKPFLGTDVLLAHLGDIYEEDMYALELLRSPSSQAMTHDDKHLGFFGVLKILEDIGKVPSVPPRLLVVSEFGEELGDMRLAVAAQLQELAKNQGLRTIVAAGDIGQCYYLLDRKHDPERGISFHCSACTHGRKRPIGLLTQYLAQGVDKEAEIKNSCARHNH
jgi:ribonuclease BN (tRNA processing enzyme)